MGPQHSEKPEQIATAPMQQGIVAALRLIRNQADQHVVFSEIEHERLAEAMHTLLSGNSTIDINTNVDNIQTRWKEIETIAASIRQSAMYGIPPKELALLIAHFGFLVREILPIDTGDIMYADGISRRTLRDDYAIARLPDGRNVAFPMQIARAINLIQESPSRVVSVLDLVAVFFPDDLAEFLAQSHTREEVKRFSSSMSARLTSICKRMKILHHWGYFIYNSARPPYGFTLVRYAETPNVFQPFRNHPGGSDPTQSL